MNIKEILPHTLRTISGSLLDLVNPKPHQIDIQSIVYSLSREYRFANQTTSKSDVLSHSYRVYIAVKADTKDKKMLRTALLHDATEAYLRDIPKPLKELLPEYKTIENKLYRVIADKYNLYAEIPEIVHQADLADLHAEWENWDNKKSLDRCTTQQFISVFNSIY